MLCARKISTERPAEHTGRRALLGRELVRRHERARLEGAAVDPLDQKPEGVSRVAVVKAGAWLGRSKPHERPPCGQRAEVRRSADRMKGTAARPPAPGCLRTRMHVTEDCDRGDRQQRNRLVSHLLFGLDPIDVTTALGAPLVDPIVALRQE
jgi:hypothetical protein